jgi:hypothetical protein
VWEEDLLVENMIVERVETQSRALADNRCELSRRRRTSMPQMMQHNLMLRMQQQ